MDVLKQGNRDARSSQSKLEGHWMDRPSPELVDCPSCRVKNFAIDDCCTACGEPLAVVILPRPKVRRIALSTIMVMVAVLAVCFAAVRADPVLGMAVSMVVVPAALITINEYESRKADNRPLQRRELARKSAAFLTRSMLLLPASAALCLTVAVPIYMAIFSSGPPTVENFWIVEAICGSGVVLGIGISVILGRILWPIRD